MGNVDNPTKVSQGTLLTIQQQYKKASLPSSSLKKPLSLSQLLLMKPPQSYPFSFSHIGIIFLCDKELDSLFSMSDLLNFTCWIQDRLYGVPSYEFKSQLQAQALHDLIEFMLVPGKQVENERRVIDWIANMLVEDQNHIGLRNNPKSKNVGGHKGYVKISQMKLLYDICNVQTMNNIDYQYFINLVKPAAEEMGFKVMEAYENEELEEYVALDVCKYFCKFFLRGIKKIVKEIGFDKQI